MAQLDNMLRALVDRGAKELFFKEGGQPTFRYSDGDKPVSAGALSRAQIITLISELAAGQDGGALKAGNAAQFTYRLGDGKTYTIEAGPSDGSFAVRIVPQRETKAATGAPAPAATPAAVHASSNRQLKPIDLSRVRDGAPAIEAYLAYMVENKDWRVIQREIMG